MAACLEPVAQLTEVLDDPVVDDRDVTGAVLVRVGVQVVRTAVRRPARMRQADGRVGGPVGDRRSQVGELAGLLLDEQVPTVVDERDTGRVVSAVLEACQSLDEDRTRFPGPRIAHDAAHQRWSPFCLSRGGVESSGGCCSHAEARRSDASALGASVPEAALV